MKLQMSIGLVLTAASSMALAQSTPAALEEVVVTAQKVSESSQKAALSLTVLTEEKLKDMGAQSFVDYAASVPALSFESLGPGEQHVLLRGVSDGVDVNTGIAGQTQNVTGIYIDDMVVSNNDAAPDLNLFDVERIEVLKGPQGTLYGDGSVGGLLRIITNKADPSKTAASLEASGASIDHGGGDYSLNGMYNVPIVQDKLGLRLVGQYRDNQGFIDDVRNGRPDVNNLHQVGGRASLRWLPEDNLTITFNDLFQRMEVGNLNDYNGLAGYLERNTIFEEPKDTKFSLYNTTVDWSPAAVEVVSSTSYAIFDRVDHEDFTDFLTTAIDADFGIPGVVLPSHSYIRQHSKTFSQEIRLISPTHQRVTWIGGLYFFKMDERDLEDDISDGLFDFFGNTLGSPIAGTPLDVGQDVAFLDPSEIHRREFAAFGEATLHVTDRVSATVGARWFRDNIRNVDNAGGVFAGGPPTYLEKSTADHNQVFRFRLADQITDDALVYALASQGYRTGGLNPLNPATTNNPLFPQAFGPDKLWNYELGTKTEWFDHRLMLNGSMFYIDWKDEQIEVALPGGFDVIANAGRTRIKGVEFDTAVRPVSGLEIGINGSYIRAELAGDLINESDPTNPIVIGLSGDQLTGVPKTQGSAYTQWTWPLTASVDGFLRSDVQYVGRTARFFAHDSRVPAPADQFEAYGDYTLVNLRMGAESDRVKVTLFANNIANRRAYLFRGLQGTSTVASRDDIYVAQPRTVGVTVSHDFQ
ncbi:MAG TPA: TonB-dependent receptor [Steroidobacteraceae bacterium]|nr:TonB-dependent receptor [Steroidobacteraceae bacterium]